MFLNRVQIGSYFVGSIRVDSFQVRIYSGRFFSDPDLFGSVPFGSGFFRWKNFGPKKYL